MVYYLKKRIICEHCTGALVSDTRDLFFFSFINKKNKGGLQYLSENVIKVCMKTETIIKRSIVTKEKVSVDVVISYVLKQCISLNIFQSILVHSFDQSLADNHRILLIKAVISRYFNIRMLCH